MPAQQRVEQAVHTILTRCLALPTESELAIVADETTMPVSRAIAQTAEAAGHRTHIIYFPVSIQSTLGQQRLGESVRTALRDVAGTILCINGQPSTLPFRDNVRRAAWGAGRRVAHMPGATWRTLLAADVDYAQIEEVCEGLALALVKSRTITIESWDRAGQIHCLQAQLSPWKRLPIISDGIIYAGSWGNIPSGETYIAPIEGTAEGTIVIDGSLPGLVMNPLHELILSFEAGRLVRIEPEASVAAQYLIDVVLKYAREHGDANWNNLAEIGLGANRHIRRLTGSPLLDEKKYGTVHIAVGDNIDMGGEVESMVHCDMVCLRPTIRLDGVVIVTGGQVVLRDSDWRENHQAVQLPGDWTLTQIKRTPIEVREEHGQLRRLWDTSSGRVCSVPVGERQTATKAAAIWRIIKNNGEFISLSDLFLHTRGLSFEEFYQLVYLLQQYGLIQLH